MGRERNNPLDIRSVHWRAGKRSLMALPDLAGEVISSQHRREFPTSYESRGESGLAGYSQTSRQVLASVANSVLARGSSNHPYLAGTLCTYQACALTIASLLPAPAQ